MRESIAAGIYSKKKEKNHKIIVHNSTKYDYFGNATSFISTSFVQIY
jgi:hypothetical protein